MDTRSVGDRPHVVHALARRVRLRAPALTGQREACERVARRLAEDPIHDTVTVRPLTGSVIVESTEAALDPAALQARLGELIALERNEKGEPLRAVRPEHHPGPTRVAKTVAHAFAEINADVRVALDDRADLGTILPVFFAVAGLAEVALHRKLPIPAWFNLLWWSQRTFMTFNIGAVEEESHNVAVEVSARAEPDESCEGPGRGNGEGNGPEHRRHRY